MYFNTKNRFHIIYAQPKKKKKSCSFTCKNIGQPRPQALKADIQNSIFLFTEIQLAIYAIDPKEQQQLLFYYNNYITLHTK